MCCDVTGEGEFQKWFPFFSGSRNEGSVFPCAKFTGKKKGEIFLNQKADSWD